MASILRKLIEKKVKDFKIDLTVDHILEGLLGIGRIARKTSSEPMARKTPIYVWDKVKKKRVFSHYAHELHLVDGMKYDDNLSTDNNGKKEK